jgi:hypothetical protein
LLKLLARSSGDLPKPENKHQSLKKRRKEIRTQVLDSTIKNLTKSKLESL